jgi:GNAT superfamily N-acetyltransferase
MDALIRPLETGDRPAAAPVLDDAVGAGFWRFDGPGEDLSFVAVDGSRVAGVALCRLEAAGDPDACEAFAAGGGTAPDGSLLHVRAVAVAPEDRRRGIARRLLAHAETEAARQGAGAAYLFAWLPAGRPEPAAVPLYLAAGYVPGQDLEAFYADGSVASGADCPYCGAPPCRCAARPFVKILAPA